MESMAASSSSSSSYMVTSPVSHANNRDQQQQKVEDVQRLDQMLKKLYAFRPGQEYENQPCPLSEDDLVYLIDRITNSFKQTPALIEIEAPVILCGDIHGQYRDLKRLFSKGGQPPRSRYLFLGDYVDRGPFSVETVSFMFVLKLRFPNDFFILRGNHETAAINYVYGFYKECEARHTIALWYHFQTAFDSLPVAGIVSNRIFCMHGGLSPELHSFQQLKRMLLPFDVPETGGLVCDLLWADPCNGIKGFVPSTRGVSYKFGEDIVAEFCSKHDVDLVARAHQVVSDGIEFFAGQRLITIFSAPAYCNQFDNMAGMLTVSANLSCKILKVKPATKTK